MIPLISILLFTISLKSANAIACYQCSGKYDANCLSGIDLQPYECSLLSEQQKAIGIKCSAFIAVSKDGTYAEAVRTCISKKSTCLRYEQFLDGNKYKTFGCNICDTDGCNGEDLTKSWKSIRLNSSTSVNLDFKLLPLIVLVFFARL